MCYIFCKQFKGWCKSFTKSEVYLSITQGILLAGFIAFLTFLILHFIACVKKDVESFAITFNDTTLSTYSPPKLSTTTSMDISTRQTLLPNVQCTWDPSHKTEAVTHYYYTKHKTTDIEITSVNTTKEAKFVNQDELFVAENDGIIDTKRKNYVLALVKMRPPQDVVFGCILTVVNPFWTITAASCIESIEEVDSLDSFVMMDRFGEKHGSVHAVLDVMIHPLYQGTNRSYDLAALKSEDKLNVENIAILPNILDYLLITLGENLDILGFGRFRRIDKNPLSRSVHSVTVNVVPLKQCEAGDETWSLRHLVPGGQVVREGCSAGRLCAGVLGGRSTPCNYCAGTPLLRGAVVVGIMSDNRHCGLACEPNLYVNVADLRDWIESVIHID